MKVYKFKCDSCGSKRCIKVDDGYKCEYCGSIQDVIMPPEPEIKEPETNNVDYDNAEQQATTQLSGRQKSILIRLIICLFAGYFGVHKFLEGRILTGIIYLCTGGLFGIGITIDVVRYILKLVESKHGGGEY